MDETTPRSQTRRLVLFGLAVAIPLAAVALYFAIVEPPPPAPPAGPPAAAGGGGQGSLPPNHPPVGTPGESPQGERHPPVGSAARTVRVPEAVQGTWQAVKLQVERRGGGKGPQVFTVRLGEEFALPGSALRVRVGDFLPALQVNNNEITSVSNDPTNPAVMVTVVENGKEIFRGWLFGSFPEMQPFEHPTYRITLVEGVPAR